jgi:hypothetical protein
MHKTRRWFQPQYLLEKTRNVFTTLLYDDGKNYAISTVNCFMSGLAVFHLKYPSLLQFEQARLNEPRIRKNLKTLYGIDRAPCDTQLRERLDEESTKPVRYAVKALVNRLQRTKALETMKFLDEYYLVAGDATGFYTSNKVKCNHCCTKVHNRGKENEYTEYTHQMLVGSIVHPNVKTVFPLGFEPIERGDGSVKNDCEQNAGKRWIDNFRQDHPKLNVIFLGDGLYSKGPFIQKLMVKNMRYILVAKPDDHKALYDYFWAGEGDDIVDMTITRESITTRYRFMHNVPLNDTHPDLKVTVVYSEETDTLNETTVKRMWVTDLPVTKDNVAIIVKGARTRWKIENETFNCLKTKGYNFEHNYGHGHNGLANVFAGLMLLAFLIDQILEAFNKTFQAVLKKMVSRIRTWEICRSVFFIYYVTTWEAFYRAILDPPVIVL